MIPEAIHSSDSADTMKEKRALAFQPAPAMVIGGVMAVSAGIVLANPALRTLTKSIATDPPVVDAAKNLVNEVGKSFQRHDGWRLLAHVIPTR